MHTARNQGTNREALTGPLIDIEKITCAEEIDKQWEFVAALRLNGRSRLINATTRLLAERFCVSRFLVHHGGFSDVVEVLYSGPPRRTSAVRGVIGPGRAVDTPSSAIPFTFQGVIIVEAPEKNNATSYITQGGHIWLGTPFSRIRIMLFENFAELLIGSVSSPFAFDRKNQSLRWMLLQKFQDCVVEIAEVFRPSQRNGKDRVNEDELIIIIILGFGRLHSDIEESDTVRKLLLGRDGLTPHTWWSCMAGWRVVCAWDRQSSQGRLIRDFFHPGVGIGTAVEGDP